MNELTSKALLSIWNLVYTHFRLSLVKLFDAVQGYANLSTINEIDKFFIRFTL